MNANDPEVQESSLILFNVLICKQTIEKDLWLEKSEQLKMKAIKRGLYPMGPLVMTIEPLQENDRTSHFKFYLPLNGAYECTPQNLCHFEPSLMVDHSLMIRHYEEGKPFSASYEQMGAYAAEHHLTLSGPAYHVMIPVYGDYFAEIHMSVQSS